MRGLSRPLDPDNRRRSLSGAPADWNVVLIVPTRDFLPSLRDCRARGGELTSRKGPDFPFEVRGLDTRGKSRLRLRAKVADGSEEGEGERSMRRFRSRGRGYLGIEENESIYRREGRGSWKWERWYKYEFLFCAPLGTGFCASGHQSTFTVRAKAACLSKSVYRLRFQLSYSTKIQQREDMEIS